MNGPNILSFALVEIFDLYRKTYRFGDSLKDILIVGNNELAFSYHKGNFTLDNELRKSYLGTFNNNNGTMSVLLNTDTINGQQLSGVLVGVPVFQTATNDMLGVVVFDFTATPFVEFLKQTHIGKNGRFLIIDNHMTAFDADGKLAVNRFSKSMLGENADSRSGYYIEPVENDRQLVIFHELNEFGWRVVGYVLLSDIMGSAYSIWGFTVLVSLICMCVSIMLNIYIIRWLFVPLDRLRAKMENVAEGNLNVKVSKKTNDEIAQLNGTFNNMVGQIRYLIQKNSEEQEKLQKAQFDNL